MVDGGQCHAGVPPGRLRGGRTGPMNLNLKRNMPADPTPDAARHVIDEYRHRAQTVTCTCGWHGSTASADGRTSEWSRHVAENRRSTR